MKALFSSVAIASLLTASTAASQEPQCAVELVVLGAGQDAGAPQIGNADDDGERLLPSSLGLIDWVSGQRFLLDATPAITEQLALLDTVEPPHEGLGVDGVFLTHAHIGHYLGLAYFGREAAGANGVPVYAMPRMEAFLRENGPWSQLVELGNIRFKALKRVDDWLPEGYAPEWLPAQVELREGLGAIAVPVPHRDEFSETVGWVLLEPRQFSVLYLPDIDSWEELAARNEVFSLQAMVARTDMLFVDATFWDDNELPGRDMSEIPHPRVTETMDLLQHLPPHLRARVHFIHYNHTNPIRDPESAESREVLERGFNIARRGDRHCLSSGL